MERVYERSRADFVSRVMTNMGIGLFITFVVAYFTASSDLILSLVFSSTITFFGLIIAEIGLVFYLSRNIESMSFSAARASFFIYAVINGLTLSSIFIAYDLPSISTAFLTAAVMFLAAGFIGMSTKRDLSAMGQFMMLMLIGIIVTSLINMFMRSAAVDMFVSLIGVVVFSGLTAYDMQKIKGIHYEAYNLENEAVMKYSIIGALALYLDFINIFLYLLRLFGRRD